MAEPIAPPLFVDDPKAPEFFATGLSGFLVNEGNIHLTFEAVRVNHVTSPGPVNRVVVVRLILPILATQRLVVGLYDFLKNSGLDPAPTPPKDKMQ
jgi:hypothetical protein